MGLVQLKSGDPQGAQDSLLKATLIEPRHARAHVYLAVAYWQQGRVADAFAQLRTASVHDPKDPLPYQFASMMYSDLLRPGDAMASAREAIARLAFVKSLDAIANNLRGAANLGAPLAQLGLESWALKNAQDSFDPLWAGSHLFLADRLPGKFAANSELYQGFLSDPLAFGASNRFQSLVSAPGNFGTLAWRGAQSSEAKLTEPQANVNGLVDEGHIAYFLEGAAVKSWRDDRTSEDRATSVTWALGLRPRDDLGFFVYGNRLLPDTRAGFPGRALFDAYQLIDGVADRIDAGMLYRPGPDSQFWLKGGHGSEDSRLRARDTSASGTLKLYRDSEFTTQPRKGDLGLRGLHRYGNGIETSFTIEAARWDSIDFLQRDAFGRIATSTTRLIESVRQDIRDDSRSAELDVRWPVARGLLVQAQGDHTRYEKTNDILVVRDYANQRVPLEDDHERSQWSPRAGFAWTPIETLTLRAAYQKWLRPASTASLKASSTAGIALDDRYVLAGGRFERSRAQFEWQLRPEVLVSAFADRQEIDNLYSPLIGVLNNRPDTSNLERLRNRSFNALASLGELEGFPELSRGKLTERGLTVNALAMRQLSLFAEGIWATSRNTGVEHPGAKLAFLPAQRFAVGATFFSDRRWSLAAKWIRRGERFADEANSQRLAAEWSGALQAYWETSDKRWSLEAIVTNIGAKTAKDSVGVAINYRF